MSLLVLKVDKVFALLVQVLALYVGLDLRDFCFIFWLFVTLIWLCRFFMLLAFVDSGFFFCLNGKALCYFYKALGVGQF